MRRTQRRERSPQLPLYFAERTSIRRAAATSLTDHQRTWPRSSSYAPTCLSRWMVGLPSMNSAIARPSVLKYSVLRWASTAA